MATASSALELKGFEISSEGQGKGGFKFVNVAFEKLFFMKIKKVVCETLVKHPTFNPAHVAVPVNGKVSNGFEISNKKKGGDAGKAKKLSLLFFDEVHRMFVSGKQFQLITELKSFLFQEANDVTADSSLRKSLNCLFDEIYVSASSSRKGLSSAKICQCSPEERKLHCPICNTHACFSTIQCHACDTWTHFECTGLQDHDLAELIIDKKAPFSCVACKAIKPSTCTLSLRSRGASRSPEVTSLSQMGEETESEQIFLTCPSDDHSLPSSPRSTISGLLQVCSSQSQPDGNGTPNEGEYYNSNSQATSARAVLAEDQSEEPGPELYIIDVNEAPQEHGESRHAVELEDETQRTLSKNTVPNPTAYVNPQSKTSEYEAFSKQIQELKEDLKEKSNINTVIIMENEQLLNQTRQLRRELKSLQDLRVCDKALLDRKVKELLTMQNSLLKKEAELRSLQLQVDFLSTVCKTHGLHDIFSDKSVPTETPSTGGQTSPNATHQPRLQKSRFFTNSTQQYKHKSHHSGSPSRYRPPPGSPTSSSQNAQAIGTSPKIYNQRGQQAHSNQYPRHMSQHQDRQLHSLTRTHKVHHDGSNSNLPSPYNSPVSIHHPVAEDAYGIPTSNRFESLAVDEEVQGADNSDSHLHREPVTNHSVTSPKRPRPTNHRAIPCGKTLQMHHFTPGNSLPNAEADKLPLGTCYPPNTAESVMYVEGSRGQDKHSADMPRTHQTEKKLCPKPDMVPHTVEDEHLTRTNRPMHDDLNKAFPSKPNCRSSAEVRTSNISNWDLQQNVSGSEVGKRPRPSSFSQSADVMSNKPPNWDLQQNATLSEVNNQRKPSTLFRPAEVMSSNSSNGDHQQKVTGQVFNNQPEQSSLFRHGRASTATYYWQMETVYYLTASLLNLLSIHTTHPNSMVEDSIREQHLRIMQLTESSLRLLPPQRR